MTYIPFDDYKRKWIFTHQSMPVEGEERDAIKPLTALRSAQLWSQFVSNQSPTADHFGDGDWIVAPHVWKDEISWQIHWDEEGDLPEIFIQHFPWDENQTIYFCYDKENVIETRWGLFKKYWKNFLFYDDKPILLGRRKNEVAMFEQSGLVKWGLRP